MQSLRYANLFLPLKIQVLIFFKYKILAHMKTNIKTNLSLKR